MGRQPRRVGTRTRGEQALMARVRTTRQDWRVGDRVTRPICLDDGTWTREGDVCLPGSLRHGTVELREKYGDEMLFHVLWDDGTRGRYFWHGIDAEGAEVSS